MNQTLQNLLSRFSRRRESRGPKHDFPVRHVWYAALGGSTLLFLVLTGYAFFIIYLDPQVEPERMPSNSAIFNEAGLSDVLTTYRERRSGFEQAGPSEFEVPQPVTVRATSVPVPPSSGGSEPEGAGNELEATSTPERLVE